MQTAITDNRFVMGMMIMMQFI